MLLAKIQQLGETTEKSIDPEELRYNPKPTP
jgi:hypothetical protein